MKFTIKVLPAALLLAGLSPMAAHALVLPLTADTHLATTAAGSFVAVNVNTANTALLNFDVTTLPAGTTSTDIAKATLVFFVKGVPTAGRLQVSPLTNAWTENATTSTAPLVGLPVATSAPLAKGNSYFAIDVTTLVQNWIDVPAANFGLALQPAVSTFTSLTIDSKEALQTSHPAYIEIALKGTAGQQGTQGETGLKGLTGLTGATGETGAAGSQGGPGLEGAPGNAGLTGATGPQGVKGLADTSVPVHAIGDSFGGGIVFFTYDGGQHGLIAATADQSANVVWWGGSYTNTLAKADGLGAGKTNTGLIIAAQGLGTVTTYAARVCNEYTVTDAGVTYADWYLPSKYELNLLYQQKTVVGGFANNAYWSSSESSFRNAWAQNFSSSNQNYYTTDSSLRVRAVRAF